MPMLQSGVLEDGDKFEPSALEARGLRTVTREVQGGTGMKGTDSKQRLAQKPSGHSLGACLMYQGLRDHECLKAGHAGR